MNNFVKIRITGKNPSLFVRRILRSNISYKDFKQINHQCVELKVNYNDYISLEEKNTIYKIEVIKYYGIINLKKIIENNKSFFIAFFISILVLFIISNVIFKIEIVHNDSRIRKLVKNELSKYEIKEYRLVPSFNKLSKVKEQIIKNNKNDIEWMEVQRRGSKLIVKVTQRKLNKKEEDLPKRHIIAKKSGIIMSIKASNGEILKKVNDYVTKGEIIISGDIIKDETVKGQVTAKGVVYAETWYNVNVEYPLYYEQTTYLNKVKNNVIIKFINSEFALRKNYEKSYLEKKKQLVRSKIFPFEISVEKQRKIKVTKQKLTEKEAIKKAQELAYKKLKTKLDDDEYVISKKTLNFLRKDSKIVVDVFFKVCENITDYMNVDESLLKTPQNQE